MDLTNASIENYSDDSSLSDGANLSASVLGPADFNTDAARSFVTPTNGPAGAVVPDELRCRYSNKKCMNPRTEKRTGGLHTFCAEHRESANRNQRRLDLKKRVEKRQQESILSYYETLQAVGELPSRLLSPQTHLGARPTPLPPALPPVVAEPYARPAALLEEDLDVLANIFGLEDQAGSPRGARFVGRQGHGS